MFMEIDTISFTKKDMFEKKKSAISTCTLTGFGDIFGVRFLQTCQTPVPPRCFAKNFTW